MKVITIQVNRFLNNKSAIVENAILYGASKCHPAHIFGRDRRFKKRCIDSRRVSLSDKRSYLRTTPRHPHE